MTFKSVKVRVVDNGYIVIWDEDTNGVRVSHEEIVSSKGDLRAKLVELFEG